MSTWQENIEQLTKDEFDAHVKNGTFQLAFVGMSNAGKSYRSRVLQNECEFFWHHVDGEIQQKLGFADMDAISEWMGYPSTENYKAHERAYLDAEEVCTKLNNVDTEGKNLVFDTTGSVVYLSEDVHRWLHEECFVVYIEVGKESIDQMIQKFFEEPKPVVWNSVWQQQDGEPDKDALRRLYPELLESRQVAYQKLAHVTVPLEELKDTSGEETLAVIRGCLG